MRLNPISKALSRGTFLVDQRALGAYIPLVREWYASVEAGETEEEKGITSKNLPYTVSVEGGETKTHNATEKLNLDQQNSLFEEAPAGSVAIIPIKGVILKEDYCGTPGTATLAYWAKQAANNPNIIGIVYDVDSPGGTVDGTGEAADVFEQVKTTKPTITFVNGLMASAAYWTGSAGGREIYMSHATAEAGSIGTKIHLNDWRKYDEMMGLKEIVVKADASKDKGASVEKALDGDYKPIKIEILNPTNDVFLKAVKRNRTEQLQLDENNEPLTGKIYVGENALKIGLVDGFKTLDDCIERVIELHEEEKAPEETDTNSKTDTHMKVKLLAAWTALLTLFGLESKDGEDVETTLSQEQLEELNAKVEKVTQLETDLEAANAAKTKAENELATEKEAHDAVKTELAELKKTTPASTTEPTEDKPDALNDTADDEDEFESPLDKQIKADREAMGLNETEEKK